MPENKIAFFFSVLSGWSTFAEVTSVFLTVSIFVTSFWVSEAILTSLTSGNDLAKFSGISDAVVIRPADPLVKAVVAAVVVDVLEVLAAAVDVAVEVVADVELLELEVLVERVPVALMADPSVEI